MKTPPPRTWYLPPLALHLSAVPAPRCSPSSSATHTCSEILFSCGAEVSSSTGAGIVSGGAGTQGTYTALDPEGLGFMGGETVQSRSPGLSTKAGQRAAMHITGPTLVTVPSHIASNLALGVLQGDGGNRIVHCSRDKDGGGTVR
ncbi:hypothetical protein INR49_031298 [Caranx melampygus]|nr:hypothetical protein INR49_031298 [Caranx melampygus]